jgi:hypothetical protein
MENSSRDSTPVKLNDIEIALTAVPQPATIPDCWPAGHCSRLLIVILTIIMAGQRAVGQGQMVQMS